ncbi:MAG: hypothetical protein KA807_09655 [Prolixibacteraceae bacterium]|nr:hypothetical protein [Prolixibacteraceae bacterium]
MKKVFSLLVIVLSISIVSFGQSITSSDYAIQHPGLPSNTGNAGVIKGNSIKVFAPGATYTYVGQFNCSSGPSWTTNPPCYTGQEAAALLFGGNPGDYATSTNSNTTDPSTITFTCWCDGWGMSRTEQAQDFKLDVPPSGYEYPSGYGNAISAYVLDHSIAGTTYVWRVSTPVPVSRWAVILGFSVIVLMVAFRFFRRRV